MLAAAAGWLLSCSKPFYLEKNLVFSMLRASSFLSVCGVICYCRGSWRCCGQICYYCICINTTWLFTREIHLCWFVLKRGLFEKIKIIEKKVLTERVENLTPCKDNCRYLWRNTICACLCLCVWSDHIGVKTSVFGNLWLFLLSWNGSTDCVIPTVSIIWFSLTADCLLYFHDYFHTTLVLCNALGFI